ncbi:hypothetical protein B6U91_00105 [Candidatus Pacearchaeota archaeon ex4484_71]|nr:MAG: hypothetical protein B6U91_00105 [Candidatus Pacearchaeota archaeon ex4484_71]
MLDKLLREVVLIVVGKSAEEIATILNSKKYENEFNIAKKLDLTINQTRNILYKISNVGLVTSIRKKDKKKGWYTYFWKFDVLKCLEFLKGRIVRELEDIEQKIHERRTSVFYYCKRCNIEVNEEEALSLNFSCPECGDIFQIKEGASLVKELEKTKAKLNEKLKIVNEEMEKEITRLNKLKEKELRKIEKEKKEKRLLAAEKRRIARAKSGKTSAKKKSAKKVVKKKTTKKKAATKKKVSKKKVAKKKTWALRKK